MSALLPTYYLTHETPAGTRYAYPLPVAPADVTGQTWGVTDAPAWSSPDADTVIVPVEPEASWRMPTKAWIVSPTKLTTLVLTWQKSAGMSDWRKQADRPDDPLAAQAWDTWPDAPAADVMEHWDAADTHDACTTCATFRSVYSRDRLFETKRHEVDVTGWLPMPGAPDEHPDHAWQVADTSLVAMYGSRTRHLWPGEIPGFRDAVNEALKNDPRTSYVFTHASGDRPRGSTEVTVPIRWETPKVERRRRTGANGRQLRGMEEVHRPIATSHKATRIIPEGLAAATKAEAVAAWDAAVASEVEAFMPPPMRACSNCDGHGYVFLDGAS